MEFWLRQMPMERLMLPFMLGHTSWMTENLKSNPWAAYLFLESGEGYFGKRLYLKKLKEEQNEELINEICQRCNYSHYRVHKRYVAYFDIEKELPLIGNVESA